MFQQQSIIAYGFTNPVSKIEVEEGRLVSLVNIGYACKKCGIGWKAAQTENSRGYPSCPVCRKKRHVIPLHGLESERG